MSKTPSRPRHRLARFAIPIALALVSVPIVWAGYYLAGPRRSPVEGLPRWAVHRADLHVEVTAGGQVDSSKKTTIECELENLRASIRGNAMSAGGSSTILELVPDGSEVQRGDVICRLDSSAYEELVRQQEIQVEEARAAKLKADLDLKAAELTLTEYREGTLSQLRKDYAGKMTLAEADMLRQKARIRWAQEMFDLGYFPRGKLLAEEQSLQQVEVGLVNTRGQRDLMEEFGNPVSLKRYRTEIDKAEAEVDYQQMRLARQESQLAKFRRQVELCTVRAPHDGFVIYANDPRKSLQIDLGIQVYQKMKLFFLPDLGRMEVQAMLHESVVERVQPGMPARVKVEGMPRYTLEGHVVSVSPLPVVSRNRMQGDDVKNYLGKIKIDTIPRGLLPGMTAEVEIQTEQRYDALVVPPEAVTIERGREVCYVAHPEGLERREIHVGQATTELLEVSEGVAEGEEVVLDPARNAGGVALLDEADAEAEPEPAQLTSADDEMPAAQ